MTRRERLLEQYEDAYFALLMEDVMLQEGQRLEEWNQQLLEDPGAAVPESLDRRCGKVMDQFASAQRRRSAFRRTGKALRVAAVIMAAASMLFTSTFAVSEDFRAATMNLMLTVTQRYTEFKMQPGGERDGVVMQEGYAYFWDLDVQWLPEGFLHEDGVYNEFAMFKDGADGWLRISIESEETSARADLENADSVEEVTINGIPAQCIRKDGGLYIVLPALENGLVEIAASDALPLEDVKAVAENIRVRGSEPSGISYLKNGEIDWIPQGFTYRDGRYDEDFASFENPWDSWFYVTLQEGKGSLNVDTEDADVEEIELNGCPGLCIVKEQEDGGCIHVVTSGPTEGKYIEVAASIDLTAEGVKKIAENVRVRNGPPEGDRPEGSEYFTNARIGWLPDGFTYRDGIYNYNAAFTNPAGEEVWISIMETTGSVLFDTEDADRLERLTLNGYEGLLVEKMGEIRFCAADLENQVYLSVDVSKTLTFDVLKRIVENLRIFESPGPAGDELFQNLDVTWLPEDYTYKGGWFDASAKYKSPTDSPHIWNELSIEWYYGQLPQPLEGMREADYNGWPGLYKEDGAVSRAIVAYPEYNCYVSVQGAPAVARRVAEGIVPTGPAKEPQDYSREGVCFPHVKIGWLPDGFRCLERYGNQTRFGDAFGREFLLGVANTPVNIYPENGGEAEKLTINGNPAEYFYYGGLLQLATSDPERGIWITISASWEMPVEMAAEIVENVSALDGFGEETP